MNEIEKMHENAGVKPEYRYDCKVADTIKPEDVFPLYHCSKGEIEDYCTSDQYYQYCKVHKVNKIYPPFTAEKQIELIKWLGKLDGKLEITCTYNKEKFISNFYFNRKTDKNPDPKYPYSNFLNEDIEILIASIINDLWQDLTEEQKQQVKGILE